MSTQYLARTAQVLNFFEFDRSRVPDELWKQVRTGAHEGGRERDYFVIGTRFGNGESARLATDYYKDPAFLSRYYGITKEDVLQVTLSGKPFYSKWDKDSPLLLFDKPLRFVYHSAGQDFWRSLPEDIRVGGPNVEFDTLGQLMGAIYGRHAVMEAAEGVREGIYIEDPTQFPSWWINRPSTPCAPREQSPVNSPSGYNQKVDRIFDPELFLFVLKSYGYKVSQSPDVVVATREPSLREDGRSYIFRTYESKTVVTGGILLSERPVIEDLSEENDMHYWGRGLTEIIEECEMQERLSKI